MYSIVNQTTSSYVQQGFTPGWLNSKQNLLKLTYKVSQKSFPIWATMLAKMCYLIKIITEIYFTTPNLDLSICFTFVSARINYDYFPEKHDTWNVQERFWDCVSQKIVKPAPQILLKSYFWWIPKLYGNYSFLMNSNSTEVELYTRSQEKSSLSILSLKLQFCWIFRRKKP